MTSHCQSCGRTLQEFSNQRPGPYCVCATERFEPVITSMMTPEDSKRVAEAALQAIRDATLRFDAMCAQIEQTAYIKANPTRF